MEGLVVWSCLVLLQFHGVLSDERLLVSREGSDERIKRYHESDHEKLRARHELNESTRTTTAQKPKMSPKVVIKRKLPINERNQPKNVKVINHILEEIASVAHNHNQSKGIHKIKHLVDELDKQNEFKSSKLDNENLAEIDKFVKTLKKEESNEEIEMDKEISTNRIANDTNSQVVLETNDQLERVAKPLEKLSTEIGSLKIEKKPNVKIEEKTNTPEVKPTNRRCDLNEKMSYERTGKNNDDNSWKPDVKNENRIEIEEHTYEEESLHTPCKYTQPNSYNWYYRQDNDPKSYANCYTNYENYFYSNDYTIEPQTTYPCSYEEHNRNDYDCNKNLDELVTNQINECVRQRKSWLDKNTVIDMNDPSQYQVKNINEDKQEITSVYRPDFHRKYYSVTQKQAKYSSDDKNVYYKDPYHCS